MQRHLTTALFAVIFSSALVLQATAQSFIPLAQWLTKPSDQRDYPFVRCAGYYKGALDLIGTDNLPRDTVESGFRAYAMLATLAAQVRSEHQGGNAWDYRDQVVADVQKIADIYQDRMKKNYEATGNEIANDPLIRSDELACSAISEEMGEKFHQQLGMD